MVARNRLVINGSLGAGGLEQWSAGFSFGSVGTTELVNTPAALSEWADDAMAILADAGTSATQVRNMLSTAGSIDSVSTYLYGVSGPAVLVGTSTAAAIAGTGTLNHPPQISTVVSLLTGIAGRSFRGRAYWPNLSTSIASSLMMSPSNAQNIANAFAEILGLITDAGNPLPGFYLGVYSATQDVVTLVTSLAVGTAFDTQRRRRDDLVEQYLTADIGGP